MKQLINRLFEIYLKLKYDPIEYARYKGVKVGNGCRIYTRSFGSEPWLIEIGNKVTITSGVIILTHDGATWLCRDEKGRRFSYSKVKIGNNVFIGVNSIIMPGVIIGNDVIIAAGSIVTKSIPDGKIVAGNPARIIGEFDNYRSNALDNNVSELDFNLISIIDYKEKIMTILNDKPKEYLR